MPDPGSHQDESVTAVLRGYGPDDELVTEHPLGQALMPVLGADLVCRAGDLMWFLEYDVPDQESRHVGPQGLPGYQCGCFTYGPYDWSVCDDCKAKGLFAGAPTGRGADLGEAMDYHDRIRLNWIIDENAEALDLLKKNGD